MSSHNPLYDDNVVDELLDGDPTAVHADSLVKGADNAPPVTNVKGYIPYRGSEQHGVRFEPESEGRTKLNGYEAEQKAFERYVDPTVTPRDVIPLQPIPVKVVDNIDLLYRRKARATTFNINFDNFGWVRLAQADPLRKRLILNMRITNGSYCVVRISPEEHPTDITSIELNGGYPFTTLLDSEYTGPLWIRSVYTDSTGQQAISVWTEYLERNGEKIL